jgi:hypothetical protein
VPFECIDWGRRVADSLNFLHRLTFARGSEALEFVRSLRESTHVEVRNDLAATGPILVYGARIVSPDAPAELYVSVGTLALAHATGLAALSQQPNKMAVTRELPADVALLFTATYVPDEHAAGG